MCGVDVWLFFVFYGAGERRVGLRSLARSRIERATDNELLFVWAKRNFIFVDQTGWTSNFLCVFFMHR